MGLALNGLAQTPPQLINYQAVPRSANGNPMANYTVSIRFEILQGTSTGPVVFTETQSNIQCNALGMLNTQIGRNASLAGINWGGSDHFLRVGIDTLNGSTYITLGTQQLVSVPYALQAGSAPVPPVSYSGGVLSVGNNTVSLSAGTGSTGVITGSTNVNTFADINNNYTITVNPTLTVNGGSLSISGGNTVTLPSGNTSIVGGGAITVNTLVPGSSYSVSTPSVVISPLFGFTPGYGLLSIQGSYPNYAMGVIPDVSYSSSTGSLILTNPTFSATNSYSYNITPTLFLNGPALQSGPNTNTINFALYTPWRQATVNTVTLGVASSPISNSVGINVSTPSAELEINGYTKLGNGAPAISMRRIGVGGQTSNIQGGTVTFGFGGFTTAPKIIDVSVLVEMTTGQSDWIHAGYTNTAGYQFNWKVNNLTNNVEVTNSAANSANITSHNLKILVTYEP